jgi:hypothetical protein
MNFLKLFCSFSLAFIFYSATGPVQSSMICKNPSHCDIPFSHFSTTFPGFKKIIFATSKYDNSPQGAIVGFTWFNGPPLTFSSSTTTDDMAS